MLEVTPIRAITTEISEINLYIHQMSRFQPSNQGRKGRVKMAFELRTKGRHEKGAAGTRGNGKAAETSTRDGHMQSKKLYVLLNM